MKGPRKALAFLVAVAGTALVLSTSAFALGGGSAPTAAVWKLRLGPATWSGKFTRLYPGVTNDTEVFPLTITNGGRSVQRLTKVSASMMTRAGGDAATAAGADIRGCRASWFTVSVDPRDRPLPVKLAARASYAGRVALAVRATAANQDACEGAAPAFTVTAR
ncbi:MAG TPA: hypothetical protein VMA77_21115 [Solirubrobacteraceae bacterium]|nr:hypothetical protein [Solirubrobacteraceae bacterium]